MKKVTRILGMACMVGLLAFTSSCKKNQDTAEGSSVEIAVPDAMVFDDGDRAYITTGGRFLWNAGDEIVVYNLSDQYAQSMRNVFHSISGNNVPKAKFAGPSVGPKKLYGYRYFFPTEMIDWEINDGDGDLEDHNREHFVVSHTQNYSKYTDGGHVASIMDPNAMPMACDPVEITSNTAMLAHIFGVASVQMRAEVGEDIYIKQVKLTDHMMHLWGKCSVCLHNVTEAQLNSLWAKYFNHQDEQFYQLFNSYFLASAEEGGLAWMSEPGDIVEERNSIIMDCVHKDAAGNNVFVKLENGNNNATTQFNFLLRPLACSEGFIIEVTTSDDQVYTMTDYSYEVNSGDEMVNMRAWGMRPGYIKTFNYGVLHEGVNSPSK